MTGLDLAFATTGLITAAAAALAVTTRHVVHSALWLVVTLLGLAGCHLVLGAELVALVQVLVYVGAVVVLVIVALMLTRAPIGPRAEHTTGPAHRVLAACVGAGTGGLVAAVLLPTAARTPLRPGGSEELARQIFSTWVWPFELLSLLLLAALVGAFAVAGLTTSQEGTR
ncbi:NADH-quinone oxidoreductase subunit J family protein [Janibacter limosus]|jgi:NADH-quinone oxidoreductase subunit J|uniref:NADH-quinone oxidoreductase subunit J family protein n=1 Tax=Janibacter limosus TaxID=53458 RepID=UPI0008303DC6|nr:NADH-quinone oxidoreductase subunit J [Janibacter limosus]